MLIDSPYFPDELELLPALLAQSGFEPNALLATHADFDHLLGRLAFPELAARRRGEHDAARSASEPGAAQRELRDYDAEHYVERPAPLSLGQVQALPVPGSSSSASEELELHPAEGHTPDGMAVLVAAGCGVLVRAATTSRPVEIPWISEGGSLDDYRATLARLAPLVEEADDGRARPRRAADERRGAAHARRGRRLPDALERGEERPAARGPRHARAARSTPRTCARLPNAGAGPRPE